MSLVRLSGESRPHLRRAAALVASTVALTATPAAWGAAPSGDADFDGVDDFADAFPCDWRRTAATFVPGEHDYGTMLLEDNWPARGDLDFNDAVLLHHIAVFHDGSGRATGLRLTLVPRALGAKIVSGVALRLPIPASAVGSIVRTVDDAAPTQLNVLADETDLVVPVVTSLRDLFEDAPGFINTERGRASTGDGAQVRVEISFASPVALSLVADPFDLFFFRTEDPGHQIHQPQFSGTDTMRDELFRTADDGSTGARSFVDSDGLPFVLSVPATSVWPFETERVESLWPELTTFAASGGAEATDYYASNVDGALGFPGAGPAFAPSLDYGACVAPTCSDGARNGRETDLDCGGSCAPCGLTAACRAHEDCASGVCESNACLQSDTRSCRVDHGVGTQTRGGLGWGPCLASSCDAAFHVEAGECAADTRACAIAHGAGSQTWTGAAYSGCAVARCDGGYRASGNACVLVTYAWSSGAWSTCSGATASPSYGSWGACAGGSGAWSYGDWSTCSAAAVCAGNGSQSRSASCAITPGSGSQARSAACVYDAATGSQSRVNRCIDNFGETVADGLCTGTAPATAQACTPSGAPSSCGTLVASQACTPTGTSVCGTAVTSQACASPAGSQSCTGTNGSGTQTCAAGSTTWSSCALSSCNPGFQLSSGACLAANANCEQLRLAGITTSGDQTIDPDGSGPRAAFTLWCEMTATAGLDYLTLPAQAAGQNVSVGSADLGVNNCGTVSPSTTLTTRYTRVRINPITLAVDVADRRFSTSTGLNRWMLCANRSYVDYTSTDFGRGSSCVAEGVGRGTANITLTGTPFRIAASSTWNAGGWRATGSANLSADRRTLNISGGGGYCGDYAVRSLILEPAP